MRGSPLGAVHETVQRRSPTPPRPHSRGSPYRGNPTHSMTPSGMAMGAGGAPSVVINLPQRPSSRGSLHQNQPGVMNLSRPSSRGSPASQQAVNVNTAAQMRASQVTLESLSQNPGLLNSILQSMPAGSRLSVPQTTHQVTHQSTQQAIQGGGKFVQSRPSSHESQATSVSPGSQAAFTQQVLNVAVPNTQTLHHGLRLSQSPLQISGMGLVQIPQGHMSADSQGMNLTVATESQGMNLTVVQPQLQISPQQQLKLEAAMAAQLAASASSGKIPSSSIPTTIPIPQPVMSNTKGLQLLASALSGEPKVLTIPQVTVTDAAGLPSKRVTQAASLPQGTTTQINANRFFAHPSSSVSSSSRLTQLMQHRTTAHTSPHNSSHSFPKSKDKVDSQTASQALANLLKTRNPRLNIHIPSSASTIAEEPSNSTLPSGRENVLLTSGHLGHAAPSVVARMITQPNHIFSSQNGESKQGLKRKSSSHIPHPLTIDTKLLHKLTNSSEMSPEPSVNVSDRDSDNIPHLVPEILIMPPILKQEVTQSSTVPKEINETVEDMVIVDTIIFSINNSV